LSAIFQKSGLSSENNCSKLRPSPARLRQRGPDIQWLESFIAADKPFCVYLAKDEALIHRHAELSGFLAIKVTETGKTVDPATAQQQ